MALADLATLLRQTDALQSGHFLLSSGMHSSQYVQCALLLQHPALASAVCTVLADRFRTDHPEVVVGPAYGGMLVAHEVARALGTRALFAERVEGRFELRRSFELRPHERTLIVEDVVTTGASTLEVQRLIDRHGGIVIGVGALIDRSTRQGPFTSRFEALLRIHADSYAPPNCPLCQAGLPLVKPGSRTAVLSA